jgi:hypothetical protein
LNYERQISKNIHIKYACTRNNLTHSLNGCEIRLFILKEGTGLSLLEHKQGRKMSAPTYSSTYATYRLSWEDTRKEGKSIPASGHGNQYGCGTSRLP